MKYAVKTVDGEDHVIECDWIDTEDLRWVSFKRPSEKLTHQPETVVLLRSDALLSVTLVE